MEPARSIAVREGLLGVLVQWLNSGHNDLVFPAAKSIRFLATLDDSYMAGWIHSQIVNENARKFSGCWSFSRYHYMVFGPTLTILIH